MLADAVQLGELGHIVKVGGEGPVVGGVLHRWVLHHNHLGLLLELNLWLLLL